MMEPENGHRTIDPLRIDESLRARLASALAEDTGAGDVTSLATIPADARGSAVLVAKARGVVCGLSVADAVFQMADRQLLCQARLADGDAVDPGHVIMQVDGPLHGLLRGERVALNFLQRLSGVATLTARYVEAVAGTKTRVYDTRKTTPLWRELERYAVRCGGGVNHRFCLDDMILIKDNHVDASGGVGEAIRRARQWIGSQSDSSRRRLRIMAEVRTLEETRVAVDAGADLIMLDNMSESMLREALGIIGGRVPVEVSGGLQVSEARALGALNVDRISIGALTHSAPALDISLRYTAS